LRDPAIPALPLGLPSLAPLVALSGQPALAFLFTSHPPSLPVRTATGPI